MVHPVISVSQADWSYTTKSWSLTPEETTLPETNSSPMKIPIFPGKYHQNGGFSMAIC